NYSQNYNIGAGHAFSASFSRASTVALGRSNGAHGLRHSYAQNRMNELKNTHSYKESLTIVSQEMGHFRPEITEVYLR
ncbi:MAG: site-specific integrase, partial [Mariprofundaceae bacterium]|nr:site-specific integrase [Mariprofundaceae bacterium]